MTEALFARILDEIYGVFARPAPVGNVRTVLWERIREIPDIAVPGIVDRICDMERLPGNMAREFKVGWAEWRTAHPERIVRQTCQACDSTGVRYCWAANPDSGRWHGFVTSCPACDPSAPSLQDLERRGAIIMPVHYHGGVVAFVAERGLAPDIPGNGSAAGLMARVGTDPRPDARRTAHLPEAERAAYAAASEPF